jgi:glycosyltransferase involved in cell wall biosynthesis
MVSRGHDVFVAVLAPGDASEAFAAAGATVFNRTATLDRVRRHGTALSFVAGVVQSVPAVARLAALLRRDARELHIDIVHSNGFRTHLLTPLLRGGGRHMVWALRDRAPRRSQRVALALASLATHAVAANSRFTAQQLSWARKPVDVVPNPVRADAAVPRHEARAALGLPADRAIVAVVSHLHPSKGHHVAVKAMAGWEGDDRPYLALAGGCIYGDASTTYENELRDLTASHGLEGDVVMLGGVADVGLVYASAEVVVQPAIYPEGFGRVVVEAQLAGVPVIATDIGGARELIEDGASGLLVPPGDPAALRTAIVRILTCSELARRVVAGGTESARRFSEDRHVDAIEDIYRRVLAR